VSDVNYYWWKDINGYIGNVYAKSDSEAKQKVERDFGAKKPIVELLNKDVDTNRFTGDKFKEETN
jgi:hypothetical protein